MASSTSVRRVNTVAGAIVARGAVSGFQTSAFSSIVFGILLPVFGPGFLVMGRSGWDIGFAKQLGTILDFLSIIINVLLFDAIRYVEVGRGLFFDDLLVDELFIGGICLFAASVRVFTYVRRGVTLDSNS